MGNGAARRGTGISQFFRETLGANFRNERWSWGAYQPETNWCFLRVWEKDVVRLGARESVWLLRSGTAPRSPGYVERKEHIDVIGKGAEGFGVLCKERETTKQGLPRIASFDDKHLLRFGQIIEDGQGFLAVIDERVSVEEVAARATGFSRLSEDLNSLIRSGRAGEQEATVLARLGQGQFRSNVLRLWGYCCAVTGSGTRQILRASHIKPWRDCTNEERADPHNGLPLLATLDALFDAGLITFGNDGSMRISAALNESEQALLNLGNRRLRKTPSEELERYLAYHRKHVFVDD